MKEIITTGNTGSVVDAALGSLQAFISSVELTSSNSHKLLSKLFTKRADSLTENFWKNIVT